MSATLTTLVRFNGADCSLPLAGLIADANGDLLRTTSSGGAYGYGTVFEIPKTASGYSNTPTTLVSFDDFDDGAFSEGSGIHDLERK